MIEFMNLPFKENELEPFISEETIKFHYGKHHRAYVEKVNELIRGTEFDDMTLEDIILKTYEKPEFKVLYNNAGQVFNHNLYWNSMGIGAKLDDNMRARIVEDFGCKENLHKRLVEETMKVFGSGWTYLVENRDGKFEVITLPNGETPLVKGYKPILTIDVWEHAYYIDYQNRRKDYAEGMITLLQL
jgi:Fe-Mn family superoxide dismutase